DVPHQFADEWYAARFLVGGADTGYLGGDAGEVMVLQVLADPRESLVHANTDPLQMLRGADPRQLQDMRRANGATGKDDLTGCIRPLDRAAARELDRDRPFAVEHDAVHQRIGHDGQV